MTAADTDARLAALDGQPIDVVIIGAGVNGAGLFRDLCLQGIDCLIIDKGDFGSGTSAAPSRLIHGGLKYLETGEFRLVAQSTLERNLLLRNAPHYVKPLPTLIPIFTWTKGVWAALRTLFGSTTAPRSRGAVLVKIGLWLYDFYGSRNQVMPRHALLSRRAALRSIPGLTEAVVAAGTYYDAQVTSPERLVLELVRDGLAAHPRSAALNWTSLDPVAGETLSVRAPDGRQLSVRPKLVVNAAGPWIDEANATLGAPSAMIGGTKGSHILLDHEDLRRRLAGRMIYFEADDGRICLVYDHLGRVLVGSTDIPAADPDVVRCDDDEIDYFLVCLRRLLPGLSFDRTQIVYAYSGIRPLPASNATIPGLISRDHSAPVAEPTRARPFPIISLVGGKWTTFRGFAEEVADVVLARLGHARRISTQRVPIGGGRDFPPDEAERLTWLAQASAEAGLSTERMSQLLDRYGTTALDVAMWRGRWSDADRLPGAESYSRAEIDWIVRSEMVVRLEDIVMRRTLLAVTGDLTRSTVEAIADVAAAALGWTEAERSAEIASTLERLTTRHRMRL
ncbi:glycerol-3-phosphate dehydrogenase/oxidase [Mangrovicella endophytica]|uniref:glycerol-3-phosphate dehydrogenase/oxidase n=1 Tax=Mangrovicella endophytica TaxID=2066697 RepID=UPI000C9DCE27|nr:glycerol-3-phosphate dehydrogenase/oxidase [Mangrovicella endophytica]